MISKENFCSLLSSCRELDEYIQKLRRSLFIELMDAHPCFSTLDTIIECLDKEFDCDSVSYYFYERNCNGTEMNGEPTPFLWEADGTEVWIHSDEELYEYLVKNKEDGDKECR